MSQDLNFSIRHGDEFISLTIFSNDHIMCDLFCANIPHGKVTAVTPDLLEAAREEVRTSVDYLGCQIDEIYKEKEG